MAGYAAGHALAWRKGKSESEGPSQTSSSRTVQRTLRAQVMLEEHFVLIDATSFCVFENFGDRQRAAVLKFFHGRVA
jgi:hypothetical protein